MTTLARATDALTRDALTVLQPGFAGTTAPDWLLRRLGEGLASVALFGRNVTSPEQVDALFQAAVDTYGGLDIAFNNAGISPSDDTRSSPRAWTPGAACRR